MFRKVASACWPCQTLFMSSVFGHIGDEDIGSVRRDRGILISPIFACHQDLSSTTCEIKPTNTLYF